MSYTFPIAGSHTPQVTCTMCYFNFAIILSSKGLSVKHGMGVQFIEYLPVDSYCVFCFDPGRLSLAIFGFIFTNSLDLPRKLCFF